MKNKLLTRIIAIFTAVLMLESCVFAGNSEMDANEFVEPETVTIYEEFERLHDLGIVGEYPKEEFMPYENISLGEFYGMVLNIMSDNAVSDIRDINETSIAATSCGIATDKENFNSSVNCIKAVKMLLKLTGSDYKLKLETKNPSDSVYMKEAEKLGMLKGVNAASAKILDRITAMRLILNTVNADYTEVLLVGTKGEVSIVKTERTVIEEYRKIYELEGIVTATPDASLYEEGGLSDGNVAIDGYSYRTENDYGDLLGFRVEGYVQMDENGIGTVLHLEKSDIQKYLEIKEEDIVRVSENLSSIEYYSKNSKKTLAISPALRVIYNGSHLDKFTAKDLVPEIGNILLINNDNDNEYDVMNITDYKVMAVTSLNSASETIYGRIPKSGDAEDFYYGDYEKIEAYKNGEKVRLTEIKKDDVLSIIAPKTVKGKVKVYISDKSFSGDVTKIDKKNDILTIDGEKYKLSKALLNSIEKGKEVYPVIGKSYISHFDIFDEIVFMDIVNRNSLSYAYARAISVEDGMEQTYKLRIFTTDNKWTIKSLDKKIRLNGELIKTSVAYSKLAPNGIFTPTMIMFGLNREGLINRIEIPIVQDEVNEERLTSGGFKRRKYQSGWASSLGTYDVYVGTKTQLMLIPEDSSNEELYMMVPQTVLKNNGAYECTPYNMNKFRVADFIVIKENSEYRRDSFTTEMYVVTNKGSVVNSEGIETECLFVTSGSFDDIVVTASSNINLDDIKIGDLISVRLNNKTEVVEVKKWYSSSDGVQYLYPPVEDALDQVLSGRVVDMDAEQKLIIIKCGDNEHCMRMRQDVPVAFYNNETNEARTGNFENVAPGDFIVVRMDVMVMQAAVVIENLN